MASTAEAHEPAPAHDELPDPDTARAPHTSLRWRELRSVADYLVARNSRHLISRWPRGDGHTVLVIPGFMAGPRSTQFLRTFLGQLGYDPRDWGLGFNCGFAPGMRQQLCRRVRELRADAGGARVSIIGWSAGGIYARELARWCPDDVRSVITLGAPFRGNHRASHAWRLWSLLNRGPEAAELVSPLARGDREQPLSVPTTCLYSKSDGVVAWQCCTSLPAASTDNVEVHSTHFGFGHTLDALYVIADRLSQPENCWRPYELTSPPPPPQ
jgi:pimeloyl-ACP methyl ester carboxylesterase